MKVRLGSRKSALAVFQTELVKKTLLNKHPQIDVEWVGVSTKGDNDQKTSLQNLGQTGIFTKAIDQAIFDDEIDVGVHSLKDYPTQMPPGLEVFAVLKRDGFFDAFIPGKNRPGDFNLPMTILSGSPRRKAQWKARYPNHEFSELRGNMDTRLAKMRAGDGGIVSLQGLNRLGMLPDDHVVLDWMLPAPSQGIIAIVGRSEDHDMKKLFKSINHSDTFKCAMVERQFMSVVEGGCALPLGALAQVKGESIFFHGRLDELDGSKKVEHVDCIPLEKYESAGKKFAQSLLEKGGREIMERIRAAQPHDILCAKEIDHQQREMGLENGIKLHDLAVLKVQPIPFQQYQADALILSSKNALDQLKGNIDQLPPIAFVVGPKVAAELRNQGYSGKITFRNNMSELLNDLEKFEGDFIYYAAQKTTGILEESRIIDRTEVITVYKTEKINPRMARLEWDALAVFSPRGLQSLCEYNKFDLSTLVVCVGPTTAGAAKKLGFRNVLIADEPSVESIILKTKSLFQ